MKYLLFLISILFIFNSNILEAKLTAEETLDSLMSELPNAKSDSNHVKLLLTIAIYTEDYDKSIETANEALELSNKLNWSNGLGKSHYILFFLQRNNNEVNLALSNIEAAIEYFEEAGNIEKVNSMMAYMSDLLISTSDYERSLELLNRIERYYLKSKNKKQLSRIYSSKAIVYRAIGQTDSALKAIILTENIYEELKDSVRLFYTIIDKSTLYSIMFDYVKALEGFNKAIVYFEQKNDSIGLATAYANLGNLFYAQKNYEKSLEYNFKALNISKELRGGNVNTANTLLNIGNVYLEKKEYTNAKEYYLKAGKLFDKALNTEGSLKVKLNMALIYRHQLEYKKAIQINNEVISLTNDSSYVSTKTQALINNGSFFLALYKDTLNDQTSEVQYKNIKNELYLDNSIKNSIKALDILEDANIPRSIKTVYLNLSEAYGFKKDYKTSRDYLIKHHELKDSMFNQENQKKIDALTAERDRIEAERTAEKEAQIQAEKISRRNNIQYLSISVGIGILLVLMLFNSKLKMNEWVARAFVFITFILLFEFVLVVIDPFTDEYSEGEPLVKLGINLAIAFILYPMHQFFSRKVTTKLIQRGGGSSIEKILNEFKSKKES